MLFKDINLVEPIQKALTKKGYTTATPIQAQSIPLILEKNDLMGIAQTGTGKTAAFTLPILQLMYNQNKKIKTPRTLILAPTRELAAQIGESIFEYGQFTGFRHTVIFGGVSQRPQENALKRGVDIIVATPGRLLDLLQQRVLDLRTIEYFVLDEADRMLDMGFINDIKKIMAKMPNQRQSLFFSATMSKAIGDLSKKILSNPKKVEVTPISTTTKKIDQSLYFIDTVDKDDLLHELLSPNEIKSALVFTRTKHKSNKIAKFLSNKGIRAEAIHGNKSQNARTKTLADFKSGKVKVLVATEIVARGIDIDGISHVVNYEIPNEPESYVHRIGRTGRAGATGIAYSFCAADERNYVHDIEKVIKKTIPVIMDHKRHSDKAMNAKGAAAKPLPKKQFHRKSGGGNKFGSNSSSKNKNKFGKYSGTGYKKSSSNFKNKSKSSSKPFKKKD